MRQLHCRFTLNNICDGFRQAAEPLVGDWGALEALAASTLPAMQRQLKMCNYRPSRRVALAASRAHSASVMKSMTPALLERILGMPIVPPGTQNLITQIRVLAPGLSFQHMQAVEHAWATIAIHPLPLSILEAQQERLRAMGSCSLLAKASSSIHICLMCALQRRACVLTHACSLNCRTSGLQCKDCARPMQCIGMVGRVLRVQGSSYFLCPKCLAPTRWTEGLDSCGCGDKTPTPQPSGCIVCHHRNVTMWRQVVDVQRLEMRRVPLCYRHAKACVHTERVVYDILSLEAALGSDIT